MHSRALPPSPGALTFGNIGIAILEPALPMWMKEHMNADNWAQGIAFLPASVSYLLGTNVFGIVAHRIGHWLSAFMGMILCSICLLCVRTFYSTSIRPKMQNPLLLNICQFPFYLMR